MTPDEARKFLTAADLFFGADEDDHDGKWEQTIDLSDTFAWACADGEYVPDDELPLVAKLFARYGFCGVLWWVSVRRGGDRAEFADVNRFIEFVANEEAIRAEELKDTKRAYLKRSYVIGHMDDIILADPPPAG